MTDARRPESALYDDVLRAFAIADIEPVLHGGHAVNLYCPARITVDLDFFATTTGEQLRRAARLLEMRGYAVRVYSEPGAAGLPVNVRASTPDGLLSADITRTRTATERSTVRRAIAIDGLPFRVATAEDLLVLKLLAGRVRDDRDVQALAAIEGLDWAYVEASLRPWGAEDLAARARARLAGG